MPGWVTLTLSSRSSGTAMQVNVDNKKQKWTKNTNIFKIMQNASSKSKEVIFLAFNSSQFSQTDYKSITKQIQKWPVTS